MPTSKVAIVTLNTGASAASYDVAMKNQQLYAKCHGYKHINAGDVLDKGTQKVHPYMQKAYAIRSIMRQHSLSDYEYIVWMDRDAIFMNHRTSITQRLSETAKSSTGALKPPERNHGTEISETKPYDLILSVEPWAWLNSGVMIFRNTPFSAKLVDDWIETYHSRRSNYDSSDTIMIQGEPKHFRDLFGPKWSCEDQGALIALLAGYSQAMKWNTDKYDGLGVPHLMHRAHDEWAELSSRQILAEKYRSRVSIVAQNWLNTNPWDFVRSNRQGSTPFIYHFNGQKNKPALLDKHNKEVLLCRSP